MKYSDGSGVNEGWVAPRRKERTEKTKLEARRRRREFLERWAMQVGQLERVWAEQMGVAK